MALLTAVESLYRDQAKPSVREVQRRLRSSKLWLNPELRAAVAARSKRRRGFQGFKGDIGSKSARNPWKSMVFPDFPMVFGAGLCLRRPFPGAAALCRGAGLHLAAAAPSGLRRQADDGLVHLEFIENSSKTFENDPNRLAFALLSRLESTPERLTEMREVLESFYEDGIKPNLGEDGSRLRAPRPCEVQERLLVKGWSSEEVDQVLELFVARLEKGGHEI